MKQKHVLKQEIDAQEQNHYTYLQYFNRLTELAISTIEWKGFPESVDTRYLEKTLFNNGYSLFFNDEILGNLTLPCVLGGRLDVYDNPIYRRAYSNNGYQKQLKQSNSVIIYNNMLRTNAYLDVQMFARRLANIDRIIDVNVNNQKTPYIVECDKSQLLTLQNLFKKYDGNEPIIYGNKGMDIKGVTVFPTVAPYISDKLYDLKVKYWNESLTYLGITNTNITKKERMISDEVERNQGGVIASRFSRLNARKLACEEINRKFCLNVTVNFKEMSEEETQINRSDEYE